MKWGLGAIAVLCLSTAARAAGADERLDPAGRWYCLVYGDSVSENWHISLRLEPDGRASAAWGLALRNDAWRRLSNWTVEDGLLSFRDPRVGRTFEGDLSRSTLGGTWRIDVRSGGWWCSPMSADLAGRSGRLRRFDVAMATPLIAQSVQAPTYPLEAIRQAKEGRAVVCFLVDRSGFIVEPEVVELTDEVFRDPTLQALDRSRFAVSEEPMPLRPGCRSYVYRLDVR